MPLKKKPLFRTGYVAGWTEEERRFALSLLKRAGFKASDFKGLEQRMFKRLVMRFSGQRLHNFPLHPPKECPQCHRTIAGMVFEDHLQRCKRKAKAARAIPPPDLDVFEMLG